MHHIKVNNDNNISRPDDDVDDEERMLRGDPTTVALLLWTRKNQITTTLGDYGSVHVQVQVPQLPETTNQKTTANCRSRRRMVGILLIGCAAAAASDAASDAVPTTGVFLIFCFVVMLVCVALGGIPKHGNS